MTSSVETVAEGLTAEGERWTLSSCPTADGVSTSISVTTPEGYRCAGLGTVGEPPSADQVVITLTGSDDLGPATLLLTLSPRVRAAVVRLSDGTREDLRVLDDPLQPGLRLAVLVYPRHLDIHRIDLYDAAGALLDPLPPQEHPGD